LFDVTGTDHSIILNGPGFDGLCFVIGISDILKINTCPAGIIIIDQLAPGYNWEKQNDKYKPENPHEENKCYSIYKIMSCFQSMDY
jgi:hypothetical protein